MISLKSSREIEKMRAAGMLVSKAHELIASMVRPGVKTSEIDLAVERLFEEHSATPLFKGVPGPVPFPSVCCISVNEEIVHGIPGKRKLVEGDIVSVDTGCRLDGWCGDSAWTYPVGSVDDSKQKLLQIGEEVLDLAIEEMGKARWWSEVARKMEEYVSDNGFSSVEDFVGHGIGKEMHESPEVPHYVDEQTLKGDFELKPGLVIAVEPMVNAGTKDLYIEHDHWTVVTKDGKPSVHFEHTIAITKEGPSILTPRL